MTFDVIKAIDLMTERFYKEFGDVHKKETTQDEKHLTWVTSKYAGLASLPASSEEDKPYFSQEYNNFTFKIAYRIGKAQCSKEYDRGYKAAVEDIKDALVSMEEPL